MIKIITSHKFKKMVTCHFNRCNVNHSHFQPLANSTAANSSYLINLKVIQCFQDVRKQLITKESIECHQSQTLT